MMDDDLLTDTLETLEKGDTFEARLSSQNTDFVTVKTFEVVRIREIGDRNGYMTVKLPNLDVANNTRRIRLTDDGFAVCLNYNETGDIIEAVALEGEEMASPEYDIVVERDAEGNITKSELVRTDEPNAAHQLQ